MPPGPHEPVSADAILDEAIANLRHEIDAQRATVERGSLPAVRVQQVHLLQLFQNLLGNALKYRGEAPPAIRFTADREGELWKICVQDNGIGIEAEYAEHIFKLFKRLHTSDEYSGTGIGL